MHIKDKYSWLKHLDFMLIDLMVLMGAFVLAYYWKFGNLGWVHRWEWRSLFLFVCLLDLLITFLMSPYSGIFRRTLREDVTKEFLLTACNFLAACLVFYVLKIGVLFSREMLIAMYGAYFLAAVVGKGIWKKLLVEGKMSGSLILRSPMRRNC